MTDLRVGPPERHGTDVVSIARELVKACDGKLFVSGPRFTALIAALKRALEQEGSEQ